MTPSRHNARSCKAESGTDVRILHRNKMQKAGTPFILRRKKYPNGEIAIYVKAEQHQRHQN